MRRWAIAALASFPGCAKTIVPAVQAALNDADDDVKCQAVETLKTLGVPVA